MSGEPEPWLDLLDLIGQDAGDDPRWCGRWPQYQQWEQEVAKPRLEAMGYTVSDFYMGEYDSFGPLSRCVKVTKEGKTVEYVYG